MGLFTTLTLFTAVWSINIRLPKIFIFFILLVLVGCGGGGTSQGLSVSDDKAIVVSLAGEGVLYFPEGSLLDESSVSVEEVQAPLLPGDLVAVGTAFKVELEEQPSQPVEIRLPIPAGEDADKLTILRIESLDTITILQTRVENNQLVAFTPGFSSIVVARLEGEAVKFRPKVIGPDILPVGVAGQYHESGFKGIPGLSRIWSRVSIGEISYDTSPLGNSTAHFKSETTGTATISVQYFYAGFNFFASKVITVVEKAAINDKLDLVIYGPGILKRETGFLESDEFSVTARVINVDVDNIFSWSCEIKHINSAITNGCGSCTKDCTKLYTIDGLTLDRAGDSTITIGASDSFGNYGEVVLHTRLLDAKPKILSVSGLDKPISSDPSSTRRSYGLSALILGGEAPFEYEWDLLPHLGGATTSVPQTFTSSLGISAFNLDIDEPGIHELTLSVTDSLGSRSRHFVDYINTFESQYKTYRRRHSTIEGIPAEGIKVNSALQVKFSASGAFLVYFGKKIDYVYALDWGDSSPVEIGSIAAASSLQGGSTTQEHRYQSPGSYTIKFVFSPRFVSDESLRRELPKLLSKATEESLSTAIINVTESSTSALPIVQVLVTDSEASEDGQNTAEFTLSRTGDISTALTINIKFSGTASSSLDYQVANTETFVIPTGEASASLLLTPVLDELYDGPTESAILTIQADSHYIVGAAATATALISDPQDPNISTLLHCPATYDSALAENGNLKYYLNYKDKNGDGRYEDRTECRYRDSGVLLVETPYIDNKRHGSRMTYYSSGQLRLELPYVEGKQTGDSREYYESGALKAMTPRLDDKRHGTESQYFESGQVRVEIPYILGKRSGTEKLYFENGQVDYETSYFNNQRQGTMKSYDDTGALLAEWLYDADSAQWRKGYSSSGKLLSFIPYADGKIDGILLKYYETGELMSETAYRAGLLYGQSDVFRQSGQLSSSTPYVDDKIHGLEIKYWNSGGISAKTPYVNGKAHGLGVGYFENGEVYAEVPWFEGEIHGERKQYNIEGGLLKCTLYENGSILGSCLP